MDDVSAVRTEIKTWEREFKSAHGRAPSVQDIKDGKEGLPPLRNPPLLETADDLATLSHLNEPSGTDLQFHAFSLCLTWVLVLHTIRNRFSSRHG